MKISLLATMCAVISTLSLTAPVQAKGRYVSTELGMNFGSSMDLIGFSSDRPTVCDGYINPRYATVTQTPGYEEYNCTGPNRGDGWDNRFGSDEGILFGTAIGYRVPGSRLRLELEYFYRDTGYDEISDVNVVTEQSGNKLDQELVVATDGVGSVTSHNLFTNLYADFANESKFTPYLGVGVGLGVTEVDYSFVWARNPDAARIETGAGLPNVDEIRRNLAGTVSAAEQQLKDTLYGYQFIAGVDYALSESLTVGIKGRWVHFDALRDRGAADLLRSHPPYLRTPDQASGADREYVEGKVRFDGIEMFAASVNLKYAF